MDRRSKAFADSKAAMFSKRAAYIAGSGMALRRRTAFRAKAKKLKGFPRSSYASASELLASLSVEALCICLL
jgi:hypothetical protein